MPLLGVFQVHCNIFLYSTFQIISLEQSKCYRDKGSVQVEPFDVITSTFHQRNKIFVSNGNAVPTVLADRFFPQWNQQNRENRSKIAVEFFIHRTSVSGITFTLGSDYRERGTKFLKGNVALRDHTVQKTSMSASEKLLMVHMIGLEIMNITKNPSEIKLWSLEAGRQGVPEGVFQCAAYPL